MPRPRDPDIQETNGPIVTEADLNNRLLQSKKEQTTSSISAEALWHRLPDSSTADETVQGPDQRIARSHQRKRVAKICTSASGQRNDEARTSTFPTGTPAVSVWQSFLWRLVE